MSNPQHTTRAAKQGIALAIMVLVVAGAAGIFLLGRDSGASGSVRLAGGFGQPGGPGGSGRIPNGGGMPGPWDQDRDGYGSGSSDFRQLMQCLQEHGVTMPGRGSRGSFPDRDTMRSAFEACRQYAPSRGFGPRDDGGRPDDGQGNGFGSSQGGATPSTPAPSDESSGAHL